MNIQVEIPDVRLSKKDKRLKRIRFTGNKRRPDICLIYLVTDGDESYYEEETMLHDEWKARANIQ